MPYHDGTGPNGMGPNTGRGFGNCNIEIERPMINQNFETNLNANLNTMFNQNVNRFNNNGSTSEFKPIPYGNLPE